jgi:hypothetical protein
MISEDVELDFLHRGEPVIIGSIVQSCKLYVGTFTLSCTCHAGPWDRLQCTMPTLQALLA